MPHTRNGTRNEMKGVELPLLGLRAYACRYVFLECGGSFIGESPPHSLDPAANTRKQKKGLFIMCRCLHPQVIHMNMQPHAKWVQAWQHTQSSRLLN